MPLILDQSVLDAGNAIKDFVIAYNETHVDKVADLSFTVWVQDGRMFPVIQFASLGYRDLKAGDDL